MPQNTISNPFSTYIPFGDESLNTRTLAALTAAEPKPEAKKAADAIVGREDDQRLPGLGQKGVDNRTGEPLPSNVFQRGFLKGIDKTLFISILADTLSSIGGKGGTGFTRQAIEHRERQQELRARQKQLEDEREFQAAQNQANRDLTASEGKADRAHDLDKIDRTVQAEQRAAERRHELESEAIGLRAELGVAAASVEEVFSEISTYDGLVIPPHINPQAALEDPKILEEARQLVAPFKERRIMARIEATRGAKEAKRQQESLAAMSQAETLWRAGKRMPTALELESGALPEPITRGPSLGERIRLTVAAINPEEVMSESLNADNRFQVQMDMTEEFKLLAGGAFFSLDQELQAQKEAEILGNVGVLWDHYINQRRKEIKQGLRSGEFNPEGPTGAVQPGSAEDQELRRRLTEQSRRRISP